MKPPSSESTSFNCSNNGDSMLNYSFCSSYSEKSKVSGSRSKPRLVKVRKRLGSKAVRESSGRVDEAVVAPNGVSFGEFSKFNTTSFSVDFNNLNATSSDCGNGVEFVFGDGNGKSNYLSNSNMMCNRSAKTFGEAAKFENVSLGLKDGQACGNGKEGKFEFGGVTKLREEFVFGCDMDKLSSLGGKESKENEGGNEDKCEKGKKETVPDSRKVDNVDFEFAASERDMASNSSLEKDESRPSFVFGAGRNDLSSFSHTERVEVDKDDGNTFSLGNDKLASTATSQGGNAINGGFVFGSHKSDSVSVVDEKVSETEQQKSEVYQFGNDGKGRFSLSGSQLGDEISELNVEKDVKGTNNVEGEGNSMGSVSNGNADFVFGSTSSIGKAFSRSHAVNLSDKMQKMNIHDPQKIDDVDTCKEYRSGSSTNCNSNFVFGSNCRTSIPMTGSSMFSSYKSQEANTAGPRTSTAVKNDVVVDVKNSEEQAYTDGNNENTDVSFEESVKDTNPEATRYRDTKSVTGSFRAQNVPPCSSSGTLGKENQPINLTEKSMYGKQCPSNQLNHDCEPTKSSFPSLSTSFSFQPFDSVCKESSGDTAGKTDKEYTVTSTPVQSGASFAGFSIPKFDTPHSSFSLGKKLEFSAINRSTGGRRLKKTRGTLRKHTPVKNATGEQQTAESSDCCSPMDFSPCRESSGPFLDHSNISGKAACEGLAATRERYDIKEDDRICRERGERGLKDFGGTQLQSEKVSNVSADVASVEAGAREETDAKAQPCFAQNSQNNDEIGFSFSTSSSVQSNISATKPIRKYRMKIARGSEFTTSSSRAEFAPSSVNFFDIACNSSKPDELQFQKAGAGNTQSRGERTWVDENHVKQEPTQAAILEQCEKWRIKGNQAYRKGSLSKAENLYTKSIDSITHTKAPECCIEPLVLCYSNRAATRLSLGRIREALEDCKRAASLDSNFQKAQMRAAKCHLVLGEVEDAIHYFSKCLESGANVCLDRRIMIEAADGLQKSEKVVKCMNHSAELLQERNLEAANKALPVIMEALAISSYSEKLLKMKGEALCMLRKYEEVVQLCEQTLGFAEKNFGTINPAIQLSSINGSNSKHSDVRFWRWRLMSRSYFHMGRLEASLDLIKQQEKLRSIEDKCGSDEKDSSVTLADTLRELLKLKNAGNKAFQCGKHTEAVEHYTAAILNSVESRPFAAVCFCNRAAAHQALGKISDAIADCSLAIALDGSYIKALSRRATLHEMIRDYDQAANDLRRFISVLQNQSQETSQQSDIPLGKRLSKENLQEACDRLSSMERKAKKGTPLDFYLILGIKASDNASDIKKAYHKAALKHHPDKAGQFLARSESADEVLRKEIADKIRIDADRLFKMIGEAYAVLSDNSKRSTYDVEEETRKEKAEYKRSSSGREFDVYSSPFDSRSSREYGREWRTYHQSWKTYGKSSSRW